MIVVATFAAIEEPEPEEEEGAESIYEDSENDESEGDLDE